MRVRTGGDQASKLKIRKSLYDYQMVPRQNTQEIQHSHKTFVSSILQESEQSKYHRQEKLKLQEVEAAQEWLKSFLRLR